MYELKLMFDDVFFERDEFIVVLKMVGKDFDVLLELIFLRCRDFIYYFEEKYQRYIFISDCIIQSLKI